MRGSVLSGLWLSAHSSHAGGGWVTENTGVQVFTVPLSSEVALFFKLFKIMITL